MPAPSVPSRTWMAQTAAIQRLTPPLSFIQNLLFSNHRTFLTESLEVSSVTRGRKMAPMVRKGGSAIPIVGSNKSFATITAPNIRIKKTATPWDIGYARQPGTSVFPTDAEMIAAQEAALAQDLQFLRDDIGNRVEWMCAQALRGAVTYSVEDGEVFTLTYPRAAGNTVTLSTFWDDGTPTNVRFEEDIETAQGLVHAAEGLNITHALCGASAAKYLRRVAKANNFHLDTKGLLDAVQGVQWGAARNQDGARPVARINGIDFWEYATAVTDEGGVSQPMIRDKYVEFVCATPGAQATLDFAAIPDFDGTRQALHRAEIFSKSWEEKDPSGLVVLAHSRPFPNLARPDATVSMKVISG